jgi:membrane protein
MKLLERIGVLPAIRLFRQALIDFTADGVMGMAAALAFHTTISLVPLLLIFINLSGLLYRESEIVPGQIVAQTKEYIGADAAQLVEDILRQNQIAHQAEGLTWSTMITGLVTGLTLFYFASGMFHQLKSALNQIWDIRSERPPTLRSGVFYYLISRGMAALTVLGVNLFLVFLIMISAILATSEAVMVAFWPGMEPYLPYLHLIASPLFLVVPFAMVYKILPDARVAWRDIWVGAGVTAVLFSIGERFIGIYLHHTQLRSLYGASGTFVIILLWIYYSVNVLLYGAEFMKVYANTHGQRITPSIPLQRIAYGEKKTAPE